MRGIPIAGPCPECDEWVLTFCRQCPNCGLTWPKLRIGWGWGLLALALIVFLAIGLAARSASSY